MSSDALPASSSAADTVLRPSRAAYVRAVKGNLWVAIPLLIIGLVRIGTNPWLLPVFLVVIVAAFGGVLLYFRNARVEFGDGRYRVANIVGSHRAFTTSGVGTLITVVRLISGSSAPSTAQLLLTRPDGSKLLRLRGLTWEVEQFAELADDLIAHGVTVDAITEPITTAALRAQYPRLIGWWEAHPIAFGLILGVAIVALALAVAIAVFLSASA